MVGMDIDDYESADRHSPVGRTCVAATGVVPLDHCALDVAPRDRNESPAMP
jgi:hypothetical protein